MYLLLQFHSSTHNLYVFSCLFSVFPSLSSTGASKESDSVCVAHFCEGKEKLADHENLV